MPIPSGVASSFKVPITSHRFVYQKGGRSLTPLAQKSVLVGTQKGGTAVASTFYPINDSPETDALFGTGTSLGLMSRKGFETCGHFGQGPQLFAVPVAENAAGVAKVETATISGPATASGNLIVRIAGRTLPVPVASGDSANTIAAALNVVINAARTDLPVTSTVLNAVVTTTANHKGVWGQDIVFETVSAPTGVGCVWAQSAAGTGVMDETAALAAIAAEDVDTIALENHNTTSIAVALAHITAAWGPIEKHWRWIVVGEPGSIGTATTLSSAANDKGIVVVVCEGTPSLPGEIATASSLAITSMTRPNANWDRKELPLFPPANALAFTITEQQTALEAGLTPLVPVSHPQTRVQKSGVVSIVKMVTTQTTLDGQPFEPLRDLAVSRAGCFAARQLDAAYAVRFGASANPDGALADEDAIPRLKDMVANVLYAMQDAKILVNVDVDLAKLVIEKDPDVPGRYNIDVTYTVVVGLHQVMFVHRVTV
jgi:phage tail sheath gpL-like